MALNIAHIGLPKAASTYLQLHYFAKIGCPFFSTQPPFAWPEELGFVFETNAVWYADILARSKFFSREEREQNYQRTVGSSFPKWEMAARRFASQTEGLSALLSAEGLSSLALPIARHHAALLKPAGIGRIVLITRRQTDYAVSLWRQFLLAEDRFARFVTFDTLFCAAAPGQAVVDMEWSSYLEIYDAVFGQDNVLALPYEQLASSPKDFFVHCNRFLGVDESIAPPSDRQENPSRRDDVYHGLKVDQAIPFVWMPRFRRLLHEVAKHDPSIMRVLGLERAYPMSVATESLDHIRKIHRHGNQRLADRMQMDFGIYGYF